MAVTEDPGDFAKLLPPKPRMLVLDLGFLGDSIHLMPALDCIHQSVPNACVDVMVAEHVTQIMEVLPWLNRVIGYPRFPKGPKWFNHGEWIKLLRTAKYDAVLNVNGSDRSSILTWLTGSPLRLGRIPRRKKWWWRRSVTHCIEHPYRNASVFEQTVEVLKLAGFTKGDGGFHVVIPESAKKAVNDQLGGLKSYVHVSPFTTENYKELPPPLLAQWLNQLNTKHSLPIVLSVAPNEREKQKLQSLLEKLDFTPAAVFPGTLSLLELSAIIDQAQWHMGGDSGALHVALMCDTRTLAWYRQYDGLIEWAPPGKSHARVIGQASSDGLTGISLQDLENSLQTLKSH